MSGSVDPAFKQIPRGSTTFLIWRIEKLQLVPLPRDQYGSFYSGDAYIVFSATESGQAGGLNLKVKEARSLEQHIHFWLGQNVSPDESGVAAYKTVELDDFLGGAPIQHRETEGSESQRFRSYFPNGFRLMQGGVDTGFHHVTNTISPKLYAVKGKRRPVITQLAKVAWSLMNSGDVFILQTKDAIFIWEGETSNHLERLQAAKVAQQFKAEMGGTHAIIFIEDGQEEDLNEAEKKLFQNYLPLKDKQKLLKTTTENLDDDRAEKRVTYEIKLYRCTDDEGTLRVTEIKTGPLFQSDLSSGDSFIVDNGNQGIWVWIGKKASSKERIEAMRNAQGFIKKKGYPETTRVSRVIDGGEPEEFRSLFSRWKVKNESVGFGRQVSSGPGKGIAHTVQTSFDASSLHEQPKLAAKVQMLDDASGKKEVFKVNRHKLVPVKEDYHGSFFEHDCYIVKYTSTGAVEHILIYYWLGLKANNEDCGTAALFAIELDDAVGGRAIQIRVTQGKEPPHFVAMFGGQMTVYLGDADDCNYEPVRPYLLQIRGSTPHESRSTQVDLRAGSLNSNDVFVLVGENTSFLWCGKGCTGDEREIGRKIASRDRVDVATVYEGQEKDDFWSAIGGKEEYASDKRLAVEDSHSEPRLFQCSNATGNLRAEEVINFNQTDLIEDDVMLLDVGHTIFLWFGSHSNKTEQQKSIQLAQKYLKTDPAVRDHDAPILIVKQGYEPPTFTGFFGVWDRALWNDHKTFAELKADLQAEQPRLVLADIEASQKNGIEFSSCKKYPVDVLHEKEIEKLPKDVDPSHKELYLTEDDFQKVFKMDHKAFEGLAAWKQQQLKKSAGLF